MANDISITVRLPHELKLQLKSISKDICMTKTNLIRSSIHDCLTVNDCFLDFSRNYSTQSDRLVLNVNQLTHEILKNTCVKYNQSMNVVITSVSLLALNRSTKWLQVTKK